MRALTMIVLLLLVALTPGQCRPDSSTDENTLQHEKATSVSSGEMAPQVASQNAIRELMLPSRRPWPLHQPGRPSSRTWKRPRPDFRCEGTL
jgi:hypothetical protein